MLSVVRTHSEMLKVLDYGLEVSEFELQSQSCVHFRTNTIEKGIEPIYPPYSRYGLNDRTAFLLQGWF